MRISDWSSDVCSSDLVGEEADLHDGGDIHAGAEEEDVAERVVAHLAAGDVPGDGEEDHQPENGDLRRVGWEDEGGRKREGEDGCVDVPGCGVAVDGNLAFAGDGAGK